MEYSSIVLGGGCFWCVEAIFAGINGVIEVSPGYTGGQTNNATYKQVCTGATGHAEVVKIKYNPALIDIIDLFGVFFATHNPTTINRQGNDIGSQYRSVIFYNSELQKQQADLALRAASESGDFSGQIITEVVKLIDFYPAEDIHEKYYSNNSDEGYCRVVIRPKLDKFRKEFNHLLRSL
jgi:peptide-methionine (S)-S-oxide reductase